MEITVSSAMRKQIIEHISSFCGVDGNFYYQFSFPVINVKHFSLPPKIIYIHLPAWCHYLDTSTGIPVPADFAVTENADWKNVDWVGVIAWYMYTLAEALHEQKNTAILSYSFRLQEWPTILWEKAWCNRIIMFLRQYAIQSLDISFPELPDPEIIITHDLDAVKMTLLIRAKQSVFQLYNFFKCILVGDFIGAFRKIENGLRFLFFLDNMDYLDNCIMMEKKYRVTSIFNIYVKTKTPLRLKEKLINPSYSLTPELVNRLKKIATDGWEIGLHPSLKAGVSQSQLNSEINVFQTKLGFRPQVSRNHWLNLSILSSWQNQSNEGIKEDYTLGFNDRCGFRNGCAMTWQPWDYTKDRPLNISCIPLIVMDSHVFDYNSCVNWEQYIDECLFCHGKCSILWHPHTMGKIYGWGKEFEKLLIKLAGSNKHVNCRR